MVAFPLFALIGLGFLCTKLNLLTDSVGTGLSKYAFVIALPMLLFNVMSNITHLPPPNWFIAIAFFGSCFIVFVIGRVIGDRFLKLNGEGQTIFGMAGVFSNNVSSRPGGPAIDCRYFLFERFPDVDTGHNRH